MDNETIVAVLKEKGCDVDAFQRLAEWVAAGGTDEQALYRYNWVYENARADWVDGALLQNNIGKGCNAAGLRTPLIF